MTAPANHSATTNRDAALREELVRRRLGGATATRSPRPEIPRVPRTAPLPLSAGQRQLWFLHHLAPDSPAYLLPLVHRLRGPLDTEALREAVDLLVERHEILRTRYVLSDTEPYQVIDPPGRPVFEQAERYGLTGVEREEAAEEFIDRELRTAIDLAASPPLRVRLLGFAPDDHLLVVVVHHIACDAFTKALLVTELGEFYGARIERRAPRNAGPSIQYADYAVWQNEQQDSAAAQRDLAWWKEQLAGLLPLDLPTDRPRPSVRSWEGAEKQFTVPAETIKLLRNLAQELGASLFTVLLTAFQVLLSRHTGAHDVTVGTAVSTRDRPELDQMAGYAYNSLALRARWDGDPSFTRLVEDNRERLLAALEHRSTPFDGLVDEVDPARDPVSTPLFQVMLDLVTADGAAGLRLDGIEATPVTPPCRVSRFDLTVHLEERQDGSLAGSLEYATTLFGATTADRFAGHFTRLLASAAATPEAPAAALDIFDDTERTLLLSGPPRPVGTAVALDASALRPVHEDIRRQTRRTPDAVAVVHGDQRMSYAELGTLTDRVAARLLALGAVVEDTVAVMLDRGPDLVAWLLGSWRTGAAYVPLDPGYPDERLAYILSDTGTRLLVTERRHADRFVGTGVRLVVIDDPDERAALLSSPAPPATATAHDLDHLAYIIYTSGSTGRPKGVMVSHRGLANYLGWTAQAYASAGDGGAPLFSSIAFDLGMPDLFAPLLTGQPVHLIDQDFDISDLGARLLAGAPYAFIKLTPGHVDLLLRQLRPEQIARLAGLVIAAGDSFTGRLAERWARAAGPGGTALAAEYGPTEITVGNSAYFVDGPVETELVSIGRAIPHTTMLVLDADLRPVPLGGVGEVCIGGIGVARGYVGLPELTAEKFVPDPYGPPGSRLYRTGDLARVLPDGTVDFVSRTDHQIKLRGYRIEPGEIESALTADDAVAEAVAVVREDRPGDKRLVGFLVAAPDADPAALEPARLQARLMESLPAYMVPTAFVVLDALPLTANGKLDRKALPTPGRAATATGERTAARTAAEDAMARVWAEVLSLDQVGVHDNFFDLGGDSLRAVALAGALSDAGTAVSVRDVFEHRTVARLSAAVGPAPVMKPADPVAPFALITPEDRDRLPADAVDAYPVSRVQAGMIVEMFGDSGQNRYHNITSFRIRDDRPFDPEAFRGACAQVVARHEVMRTSFALTGFSQPLQIVRSQATLPYAHHDLRHLRAALQRQAMDSCAERERSVLFTLSAPPLMRMNTHVLDDESWWLSITEAHPVIEGWSYHSQLMELLRGYERIRDGLDPDLPPVPGAVRFADFIAGELRALASDEDRSFWHRVLDENQQLRLPREWAGEPGSTPVRYRIDIPLGDIEPGLRALASATGTSYKSVLHAAHAKVLGLFAPPGAFRGGMVIDARPEAPGADRVSGMYLNSVPFPYPRAAGTWGELVQEVYDREVGLWPHRRFPMPAMRRRADEGHLVDVLFHYLDFHQLDADLVDITASRDDSPNEFSLVVGTPSAGHLSIASDTRTLRRECGERLARMYRSVLADMAGEGAEGDARGSYGPGQRPAPATGSGPVDVLDAFEAQVRRNPDAVAVTAGARQWSYAELDARANGLAHRLRSLGAGPESRIGVLLDRGPELVMALIAVWKAGAAYVPVEPDAPEGRVRALFTRSECALVVVEDGDKGRIGELRPVVVDVDEASMAPVRAGAARDGQRLAYVLLTSGSTGAPKGVMVSHHALGHYLGWAVETYLADGQGGAPMFTSIGSDLGVTALFGPLMCGQAVHLLPQRYTSAELGRELLARAPYAYVGLTPGHLALLEEQLSDLELASLSDTLVCAGDAYPGVQADRVRDRIGDGTRLGAEYGPTEATVAATAHWVDGRVRRSLVPLGRALPGTTVRVLDEGGDPVPTGVVGELYIGGPGVARGYAGDPALTAERFVPDPSGPPGARLYRTGDLARVLSDGAIEFCCRADDQVKVRGHRVEPAEIEAALAADPAVREALVAAVPGQAGEARLTAWVVPAGAVELSPVALRDRLRTLLPEPLIPAVYVTVDALPLTKHGKRDRRALATASADRADSAVGRPYRPPLTPTQRSLTEVWQRTTGVERIGLDDEFRELGGDSLLALSVLAAARRAGLDLDLATVLHHSTIAALAEALDSTDRAGTHTSEG
ncbi:amino acid adenylation domain-containing protein [Streptomyces sp. NPDC058301]|uniref:amino acid adenylation domain-containing protein n=1 Tax=Streptomyces sp. NPDC058301 TaxID=3346436 RepID=UPI0036F06ED1